MIDSSPQVLRDTRKEGLVPLVSFVVPCFNVQEYVVEALNSIFRASEGIPKELIVIDDGSTDQTLATILSIEWPTEVLILSQENRGLSFVRNLGASIARGQWLTFLDSDDRITQEGFLAMQMMATQGDSDVVLGRTLIFGPQDLAGQPFYDAGFWEEILKGRSSALVSLRQEPALLALEPNMNYRWIRRLFYIEEGLSFPEGLFFEDTPAHFRMLMRARGIALTSVVYYHYRVGRSGKITEERGLRRFDVIPVVKMALEVLREKEITPLSAAFGLRVLFRLCWGCGSFVPARFRYRFFKRAVRPFEALPSSWMLAYSEYVATDVYHRGLGFMITRQMGAVLLLCSFIRELKRGIICPMVRKS